MVLLCIFKEDYFDFTSISPVSIFSFCMIFIMLIFIFLQLMKVLNEVNETLTAFSTKRERFNQIFKKGNVLYNEVKIKSLLVL